MSTELSSVSDIASSGTPAPVPPLTPTLTPLKKPLYREFGFSTVTKMDPFSLEFENSLDHDLLPIDDSVSKDEPFGGWPRQDKKYQLSSSCPVPYEFNIIHRHADEYVCGNLEAIFPSDSALIPNAANSERNGWSPRTKHLIYSVSSVGYHRADHYEKACALLGSFGEVGSPLTPRRILLTSSGMTTRAFRPKPEGVRRIVFTLLNRFEVKPGKMTLFTFAYKIFEEDSGDIDLFLSSPVRSHLVHYCVYDGTWGQTNLPPYFIGQGALQAYSRIAYEPFDLFVDSTGEPRVNVQKNGFKWDTLLPSFALNLLQRRMIMNSQALTVGLSRGAVLSFTNFVYGNIAVNHERFGMDLDPVSYTWFPSPTKWKILDATSPYYKDSSLKRLLRGSPVRADYQLVDARATAKRNDFDDWERSTWGHDYYAATKRTLLKDLISTPDFAKSIDDEANVRLEAKFQKEEAPLSQQGRLVLPNLPFLQTVLDHNMK